MPEEISDQDRKSAEVEPLAAERVVSIRKAEANRRNALKSTGPRTQKGKENSRRNAVKHGLFARHWMAFQLLGESSEEYETLLNDLLEQYQPIGRAEELEVERITICWWKLKRVSRYEDSVNHVGVRDIGRKELARQEEYCQTLDKEEENIIRELQDAKDQIETTGEVPQNLKQKVFAPRPKFESLWSTFERAAQDQLRNPSLSRKLKAMSPEERSCILAWLTITNTIKFVKELGEFRATGVREVVLAQHVIPDRDVLDRILRYETAIERNLNRALERLERLQRRRKGEPVLPPVSVRLTQ
jgi:hypothetical protein